MIYLKKALSPNLTYKIIECSDYYNPKHPPYKIIQELSSDKERTALRRYLEGSMPEVQELGVLGLASSLLVYCQNFEDLISESMQIEEVQSSWLIEKIVVPYKKILRRSCDTSQIFRLWGPLALRKDTFLRDLPYLISILREFSTISPEVIKLGRYFIASSCQTSKAICFFAENYMICLDRFYSFLRLSVQNYLHYLKLNPSQMESCREVLTWFFEEILPDINDSVTKINFQKYFDFLSKGLVIKLLKVEQLSSSLESVIKKIIFSKESTPTAELEQLIFPEGGVFNHQLFLEKMETPQEQNTYIKLTQEVKFWRRKQSSDYTDSSQS